MPLEGKQFRHYHILQLIGKGGMGEVYVLEDFQVHRHVAAKFIRMDLEQQASDNALRLHWREATSIAKLDHPAILPLYDHGEAVIDETSVVYLIMPYRPEGSLTTWLQKRAPAQQAQQLTIQQVMRVIQQAAAALQYAHDHQIMHLDIKPDNFLVRSRKDPDDFPDLLLCDFGIARLSSATSHSSQQVRGTPIYMAPEQWAGQPTFASDQYALAIMAYELLTGVPPFQGRPMQVMFAHMQQQPRPARERNPRLSAAMDAVLLKALAKQPEQRYPSIATFAQACVTAFAEMGEYTTSTQETQATSPTEQRKKVKSWRQGLLVMLILLILIASGIGYYAFSSFANPLQRVPIALRPNPTPTVSPQALYDSITRRSPALMDSLRDNTQGDGWPENNGVCSFSGRAYHVQTPPSEPALGWACWLYRLCSV